MNGDWRITFPKKHMAAAKVKDKQAFAVGYLYLDGSRAEAFMWLDDEQAVLLWLFAHAINQGKTPGEALADAERRIASAKARIAERKAAQAAEATTS